MMPVIRLNDATFIDLKSVAIWLEAKTPSEAIDKLVREKMDALNLERDAEPANSVGEPPKFLLKTPSLSYAKLIAAFVKKQEIAKPNWAKVLLAVITAVKEKGMSEESLCQELNVPAKVGNYAKEGYRYYPTLHISIQGQSAQEAWKETKRLADKHRIPVKVTLQWRDNPKAQYPGKTYSLSAGDPRYNID